MPFPAAQDTIDELLWNRIGPSLDPNARLLLLNAPQGSGCYELAQKWLDGQGELIVEGVPSEKLFNVLMERQTGGLGTRTAVIVPPGSVADGVQRRFGGHIIDVGELFLSVSDIAMLAGETGAPVDAGRLWLLTGGWANGVRILLADPSNHDAAASALRRSAVAWFDAVDPEGILRECAFLPELSEELLIAFYDDRYPDPPGISVLARAALARRSPAGDWVMPELLRKVLIDDCEWRDPQRAQWLHDHGIDAMHAVGRTSDAVRAALGNRSWRTLSNVLVAGWVDLFTNEPRLLLEAGAKLPRWAMRRSQIYGPAMKIAAAAAKDRMVIPFPTVEPDYAADRTAQLLREHVLELYERPKSEAIFAGLIELGILRFHGHYGQEGADAALRLRRAVQQATASGGIRTALAAMAELQAGMSLDIANERPSAIAAYESSWTLAQTVGNQFIAADAASKLALIHAQKGNTSTARRWLVDFHQHHSQVRWGSAMVGRAATLAEAFVAFAELDFEAMGAVLKQLPAEPDNDEFWSVHALLLAIHAAGIGQAATMRGTLEEVVQARLYAAGSPMARRALLHAATLLSADGRFHPLTGQEAGAIKTRQPEIIASLALRRLHAGDSHGTLAVLAAASTRVTGSRYENWHLNTRLAARYPDSLPEDALGEIEHRYTENGELSDLIPLWTTGHPPELVERLRLTTEQTDRLARFTSPIEVGARPSLTIRELEVLAGLRANQSRNQIADQLFVSPNTVKSQISSLYRKLDAKSKTDALEIASLWGY